MNAFTSKRVGRCRTPAVGFLLLILVLALLSSPVRARQHQPPSGPVASPATTPAFADEQAISVLDNLQAALQSYNRQKFMAQFDSAQMPKYSAFENEIKSLFDRYDSFTVTYHLVESAMQNGHGVALVDFGLDASAVQEDSRDLRRHTQLRIVVAWDRDRWRIVDLSPRAIFE